MLVSAGIEGWGDRHGRKPGCPQTCVETERRERKKMVVIPVKGSDCSLKMFLKVEVFPSFFLHLL